MRPNDLRLKLLTPVKVMAPAKEANTARVLPALGLHRAARVLHQALAKEVGCPMPGILDTTRGVRRTGVANRKAIPGAATASGTPRSLTLIGEKGTMRTGKTTMTSAGNPVTTLHPKDETSRQYKKNNNQWC